MLAGGLHGIENELAARAGLRRQRLRLRQAARARRRCARRATCSPARPSPARRSATTWSTTTSTRPTSSSPPSTPRSPTGSGSGGSSGCERIDATTSRDARGASTRPTEEVVTDASTLAGVEETDAAIAGGREACEPAWRGASPRPTAAGCCAGSPRSSTTTTRSWPSSRCATPGTRSATRAGRRATSATCWPTTRRRPSGCSAGRSRSPAAST